MSDPVIPGCTTRRRSPKSRTACLARRKTDCTVDPRRPRSRRRRVTPRRMSSWLSETRPSWQPTRAGRMSRTIVSTSGSSGIAWKLTLSRLGNLAATGLSPADVAAKDLALELDGVGGLAAQALRLGEAGSDGGHVEDPPAVHAEDAIGTAGRSGVKDRHARREPRRDRDLGALLRVVRVPARGQHRRDRRLARAPGDGTDALAARHAPERVREPARHERQHHLR